MKISKQKMACAILMVSYIIWLIYAHETDLMHHRILSSLTKQSQPSHLNELAQKLPDTFIIQRQNGHIQFIEYRKKSRWLFDDCFERYDIEQKKFIHYCR